ncbi:transcriptional regulator, TetR family [Hymenobacter roseosalivarius DSM 11622]|uniref:Transcriptional regulator, TetR family n=1 Tax=Hymenobacter roseosalivarius DSM 11622 TaxID=645990 RepID=A0A1W1URY0_9BACT|nr:TetR/AcrR family transcriptional regulator [Hymenobacter roseosalivarius]SMB83779.1 transcriptional regulator, TetR family [Hymenobacter roseosalivarius DSM 11622]
MLQTFKSNLLKEAQLVFARFGVNRLSESELMEALHVAPATFYGLFRDKDDLVVQAMAYDLERQKQEHQELFANFSTPVERLLAVYAHGYNEMSKVTGNAILEIQHLHPKAWNLMQDHLKNYGFLMLRDLIQEGVLQQQLRHDIDIELVTKILMEMLNMVLNHELFPPDQYTRAEVMRSAHFYYIRGLCTDSGLRLVSSHFAKL